MSDAVDLIERVTNSQPFEDGMKNQLAELFTSPILKSALRDILVISDNYLKDIGRTDLSNDSSIKNAMKAQGIAQGLVEAVEYLCTLAAPSDNKGDKETTND